MGGRLPGRGTSPCVVELTGAGGNWRSPPVMVAATFAQRWWGLRPAPFGWGLWLPPRSVHGHGMAMAVQIVPVTYEGRFGPAQLLVPGGVRRHGGAAGVVELPAEWPPPPVGAVVMFRPILASCPDD